MADLPRILLLTTDMKQYGDLNKLIHGTMKEEGLCDYATVALVAPEVLLRHGIRRSPGVLINHEVVLQGRAPTKADIVGWFDRLVRSGQREPPTHADQCDEVYVPKNLEDCFVELKKILKPEDIQKMKNGPEDDIIKYHFGLGMAIRNDWGLGRGTRLSNWFNSQGITSSDDMSGIILHSFWRHLNNKPIRSEEQIKNYQGTGKGKILNDRKMGHLKDGFDSAEGLYKEGLLFLGVGDYKKAIPYLEKAAKKDPLFAEVYLTIGYCNSRLKRYLEAIEAFKVAIRIKPDEAMAHYNLGVAYSELGRYLEAIEAFKEATRIKPDYANAHLDLGVAYSELGRYLEAIEAFREAIRIKPDEAMAHYNLGVAYSELGRYLEAIEAFKEATRIKPDKVMAHYNLGVAHSKLKRYLEAIEAFKEATRIKPDYADAHLNLGLVYNHLERYLEAIEAFKEATRIKPDEAMAHYNLGVAYTELGRYLEAVEALKEATRIKPDFAHAHALLIVLYLNIGDRGSALDQYNILKTQDNDLATELFKKYGVENFESESNMQAWQSIEHLTEDAFEIAHEFVFLRKKISDQAGSFKSFIKGFFKEINYEEMLDDCLTNLTRIKSLLGTINEARAVYISQASAIEKRFLDQLSNYGNSLHDAASIFLNKVNYVNQIAQNKRNAVGEEFAAICREEDKCLGRCQEIGDELTKMYYELKHRV